MKLYATTTSERASKGQGGNRNIDILIDAEKLNGIPTRKNMFLISLTVENNNLKATLFDYSEGDEILLYPRHVSDPQKGESQKGETKKGCQCVKCTQDIPF